MAVALNYLRQLQITASGVSQCIAYFVAKNLNIQGLSGFSVYEFN